MSEEFRQSQSQPDPNEPRLGAIEMEEMLAAQGPHQDEMEPAMVLDPAAEPPVRPVQKVVDEPEATASPKPASPLLAIVIGLMLLAAAALGIKKLGIGPFAPPKAPTPAVVKKIIPAAPHKPIGPKTTAHHNSEAPHPHHARGHHATGKKVSVTGHKPVMDGQQGIIRIHD